MESIFAVPWDKLRKPHVEAFLADAEEEGLLWEAKGGGVQPNAGSIRKAVCGFANSSGGYLVIGANEEEPGMWSLPGVVFTVRAPAAWLSSVIQGGLRPTPRFEVKVWKDRGTKTAVAVVQVAQLGDPPCITSDGVVYQRVSGLTVKVTEPLLLARLKEAGDSARLRAEQEATPSIQRGMSPTVRTISVGVGFSITGKPPALGNRLFTREIDNLLGDVVEAELPYDPLGSRSRRPTDFADIEVRQDRLIATFGGADPGWSVHVVWNGSVTVTFQATLTAEHEQRISVDGLFDGIVNPASRVAVSLVRALGGYGAGHLAMDAAGMFSIIPRDGHARPAPGITPIRLWIDSAAITEAEIDYLKGEYLRAAGVKTWES